MLSLAGRLTQSAWAVIVGLAVIGAYAALLGVGMARWSYDIWGALVVGPILALASWPLLAFALRHEEDRWIRRIVVVALAGKIVGALARWAVALVLYDGVADASRYDRQGAVIADQIHSGQFAVDLGVPLLGTGFLILITGIVYAVIGPTLLGGYLVFAWLGFWGLYAFYRAFRIAMPGANHRRYAVLVFFLPSLIFWPSGLGKEAWMTFGLGMATLGAAKLITGTGGAVVPFALGLLGTAMVRPHMTALVFVAAIAGFLLRRDMHRTPLTPVFRAITLAMLAVVGVLVARQAASFFDVEDVSAQSVTTVLNETAEDTARGGSAFQGEPVNSPLDMPLAAVTVLFRPFPWEIDNMQGLVTAAEGTFLLVLALMSWGRLRNLWKFRAGRAYAVLCLVYLLLFVFAFSTFNNFGLLARQRSLVYPFLLALLCLPIAADLRRMVADLRSAPRRGATLS
ncbi:hypothetical protein GCM10010531_38990 [Blastococcus jejuensis]|uniref:Uncharacterized protein n=1 Tax=Blastococcus jejuensis TaxID=351224 RepID=A0ABP6PJK1_9ACTN